MASQEGALVAKELVCYFYCAATCIMELRVPCPSSVVAPAHRPYHGAACSLGRADFGLDYRAMDERAIHV
jgi:hypothetical protein